MSKTDEQLGYGPGRVYVLYGKYCRPAYPWLESAYKIGMTVFTAAKRIKQFNHEVWLFSDELSVVHQIESDQIRILEAMFHQRYRNRMIKTGRDHISEWFKIEDKIAGLVSVNSIHLTEALTARAGKMPIRQWWASMTPDGRRSAAGKLWRDASIRIEYNPTLHSRQTPTPVEGLSVCPRCGDEFLVNVYRRFDHRTYRDVYEAQAQCTTCEKAARQEARRIQQHELSKKMTRRYPSNRSYTHCLRCGAELAKGFGPCCSRECALAYRQVSPNG